MAGDLSIVYSVVLIVHCTNILILLLYNIDMIE